MSTENPNQQVAGTQSDDDEPYFGPPPAGDSQGQGELQQPQHISVAVSGTTNHNQGQPQAGTEDGARRLDRRRLQMMAIGIVLFNRC